MQKLFHIFYVLLWETYFFRTFAQKISNAKFVFRMKKIPLYIGTEFSSIELTIDKGATLDSIPCVVLYNSAKKQSVESDSVIDNGNGTYGVLFLAEKTKAMLAGVYTIEVYKDNTKTIMLHRDIETSVIAIEVSASNM